MGANDKFSVAGASSDAENCLRSFGLISASNLLSLGSFEEDIVRDTIYYATGIEIRACNSSISTPLSLSVCPMYLDILTFADLLLA